MAVRQCTQCLIDWPNHVDFAHCPECGDPTHVNGIRQCKMSHAEARERAVQAKFERYYWEQWDAARERRGDLSPEALGYLDARRDIAEIRELEQAVEA